MASPYNSSKTGQEVDAAADLAKNFVVGTPSSDQVLAWRLENGEYKFRPVSLADLFRGVQLYTDGIKFSAPDGESTNISENQSLTNVVNAVNGKLDKTGNGSQVTARATATYTNDLALNQSYTLAQLVGYLYNKQNSPTSTNFSALNTTKNIDYLSNKTIKNIQILFDNVEPQSGTSYLSLTINNKRYNSIATTVYENPIKGYIKAEYNGYNWVVMVCYSTNNSENIGSPNIYIKTDSSANTLTTLTLSASRAVSGTFKATVFYD